MKDYINLFEILGDKGSFGLIHYLKAREDKELKILARQYLVKKNITDKDEIIKSILNRIERTLNIGYVFTESQNKVELVSLYK